LKGEDADMTDNTAIQINVDTFSDSGGHFVRTEIEVRSVTIHGPFPDPQTAQKLKADQLAHRAKAAEAIEEHLRQATSILPSGS
jgi:hypothetical protein